MRMYPTNSTSIESLIVTSHSSSVETMPTSIIQLLDWTQSLSLLLLLLGVFTLTSTAQQPAPQAFWPAGSHRPANVPGDYVVTPFGFMHPSCILQLKKGEHRDRDNVLHYADGSTTQLTPCQFPHYTFAGEIIVGAGNALTSTSQKDQDQTVEPYIGHGWIEDSNTTTNTSYGKELSTWTVPPLPLMHDGQVIYFFPGFEALNDVLSILQPVIGSYDGGGWSMSSWNCCLSGTADESSPVATNPGDTIQGTTEITCKAGTTNCSTWNVITEDLTTKASTELADTPSDGQSFNWAFGAVLEVYWVDQCLDYPPNASLTMTSKLYDTSFNLISNPSWYDDVNASSTTQPQCDYGVTASGTQNTLKFGTTSPSFGLGITPVQGIAVNQGSSNSGEITITDINGFTGTVDLSLSSLPTGITAKLTAGATQNTYTLTLTAGKAALLTGANQPATLTLTATGSGVATQTFPMNVIVNPPLTGGVGTAVNLTADYNVYAFNDDGSAPNPTDSIDGNANVYSANQLSPPGQSPMELNWNGTQFSFGTPNQANAVYGTGANTISLPGIQADKLQILATAVNGEQKSQTITVTYSDNSTQSFSQSFDDWTTGPSCNSSNQCTTGESVAVTMPYSDDYYAYPRNNTLYYLYGYSFAINPAKKLESLTLPNNRNVVLLAATVSSNDSVSLSPTSLTFSSETLGVTSAAKTVTLTNTGSDAISISSITASGDFAQSNSCGKAVASGATCKIALTFTPSATGSRTGTLVITDNAGGKAGVTQKVTLSGTGVAPSVGGTFSPPGLTFTGTQVGKTSSPQTLTFTNTGKVELTNIVISTTGATSILKETNNCPATLAVNASCKFTYTFSPTGTATEKATLSISDNASKPQTAVITGTGVSTPVAFLSTKTLSFPDTTVGVKSERLTFTITNTGDQPLQLQTIVIPAGSSYSIAGKTCSTVTPLEPSTVGCYISIVFDPTATGSDTSTITITDNSGGIAGAKQTVTLTGTGVS